MILRHITKKPFYIPFKHFATQQLTSILFSASNSLYVPQSLNHIYIYTDEGVKLSNDKLLVTDPTMETISF